MKATVLLLCLIAIGSAGTAHAAQQFDNFADFQQSPGATETAPIPNLGLVGQSHTVGNLTYSTPSPQLFMGSAGVGGVDPDPWTARLPGNQIALSGLEHLDVDLSIPAIAIGFDFVEPEFDPHIFGDFVDSTFTVTLFNGATMVDSFVFNAPNDTAAFVGYRADSIFDRIEIRETIGDNENEIFGQFYLGGIFVDDLESGDLTVWKLSVP